MSPAFPLRTEAEAHRALAEAIRQQDPYEAEQIRAHLDEWLEDPTSKAGRRDLLDAVIELLYELVTGPGVS